MGSRAKIYIAVVIAFGVLTLAFALSQWPGPPSNFYWFYLALALLASMLKLRLPGMPGTYSLGFFFALFSLSRFSLPETLIASCGAALVQSLLNSKKRPTMLQLAFNMANLCVSVGVCFALQNALSRSGAVLFRPAQLLLVAACYFVVNTGLVSGILSLLQGKSLASVSEEWYVWSFPYYLIGVALLGLVFTPGEPMQPDAALVLLPLLYLLHFYYGLSRVEKGEASDTGPAPKPSLPLQAKLYIDSVIGLGFTLLAYGVIHSDVTDVRQFGVYVALAGLASLCKIRVPRMDGTISLNFVLLLVAAASLGYTEVVAMSAVAGVVQSVWKMSRRPRLIQVLFNASTLVISTALAYSLCQHVAPQLVADSLALLVPLATVVLYGTNTLLVAAVLCLVEGKSMSSIWQNCCFWSLPYYLVGAVVASLMITTQRASGWGPAMAVVPVLLLIYVSYRAQLTRSQQV